ncbi:MAG TPA: helix-turn-helix transcriptional regulator [Streptosporangiaceae bacterium]|nr:helix-turn-helix transcriptional regulator [Streptosporangiaceae bacterium]
MNHRRTLDPDHNFYDWAAVELHRQRKERGLSLDAVGAIIDRDRSLVARIETGHTKMSAAHAERLDAAWHTGGLFGRIIRYAKSRHNTEWVQTRTDLQARATHHKIWALALVPGEWQTERYIRATFEAARSVEDIEAAVRLRLNRQQGLDREPAPVIRAYLDQGVIDQPVGGPEVMAEQLARLLELASAHTIRVVPRAVGAHAGRDGPFQIMTVDGADVVYTETIGPGRLIEDPLEVRSYGVWFDQIGDVALPRAESLQLIQATMEAFTS